MIGSDLLEYLINFLLGPVYVQGDTRQRQYYSLVRYTDKEEEMQGAQVVIKPSGFFSIKSYGRAESEPKLPLAEWEGVPLLFGEPRHEWINNGETLLLHADLIASTFYLISRYEEMTHRSDRDHMGRFPGKSSLPYRAGFLHRPIVDEYAHALRNFLERHEVLSHAGLSLRPMGNKFIKIKLTHDVYKPYRFQSFSSVVKAILREGKSPLEVLRTALAVPEKDPYYTFDQIFADDQLVMKHFKAGQVNSVLFLHVPTDYPLDAPAYRLTKPYMYKVLSEADKIGAIFGLLCSHKSTKQPRLIPEEMKRIRACLAKVYRRLYGWFECKERQGHAYRQDQKCHRDLELTRSRHSALALGEPEDVREMLISGIRHDYSMGYVDLMGFRLGTSRPVRFINPNTRELTDLIMHPMTIDACHLADSNISGLDTEDEAYNYCTALIDRVYELGGELNLSWQSDLFVEEVHPWLGRLYDRLTSYLSTYYGEPTWSED